MKAECLIEDDKVTEEGEMMIITNLVLNMLLRHGSHLQSTAPL
jgi:hypothetical protein